MLQMSPRRLQCYSYFLVRIKKEEVDVTKQPYVKEEVSVKKKPVTETRRVSEEVRSEKVNVSGSSSDAE